MAGFIIEFRDEEQYGDVMSKLHKAKKAICEAYDAMHEADESSEMSERRGMRGGYRGDWHDRDYRGGYRNYDRYEEEMNMRRDGRGRYA